jgi:hypothetical protein
LWQGIVGLLGMLTPVTDGAVQYIISKVSTYFLKPLLTGEGDSINKGTEYVYRGEGMRSSVWGFAYVCEGEDFLGYS